MITFSAPIKKFSKKGEKTGWTYIEIAAGTAQKLFTGNKKSFRIKGYIDEYKISQVTIIPMGKGDFILPLNKEIRKGITKKEGDEVNLKIEIDNSEIKISPDLIECLGDAPEALSYFNKLTPSHQKYFSNWVISAKTFETKSKRIAIIVNALLQGLDYGQMIRNQKKNYLSD